MRNLTPEFILEKLAHGQNQGQFAAVALLVDTAGFTPLTSALQAQGAEGAEIVAQVVTNLFAPLMQVVYHHGGLLVGFAGDACKAIFPGLSAESYQRALTAAWQIRQQVLAQPIQSTRFGDFPFTIKVTVAAGNIDWRIWQGQATAIASAQQATALFGGEALEAAFAADRFATAGDIILTPAVAAQVMLDGATLEPVGNYFRLSAWPETATLPTVGNSHILPRPPNLALASRFFPVDLLERQSQGEFRQVVTVFINLQTLPDKPAAVAFAAILFGLLAQHSGYLCRIGQIGDQDQGGTLLLFWGAPASHEQDVAHALQFVLDLQAAAPCPLRAGVTTHLAYSGFVGSPWREEYTCYGAHVNLAARQMVMAGWGEIWLDEETMRLARNEFESAPQGDFLFKGFPTAKAVHCLLGRRERTLENFYQGAMVGRQAELAQLQAALAPLATGKFGGVVIISGDAGIGKSRLVHELQQQLEKRLEDQKTGRAEARTTDKYNTFLSPQLPLFLSPQWFLCQTDELLRQPLNPFRYWLRRYFNQSTSSTEATNKAAFTAKLDELLAYLNTLPATHHAPLATELTRTRSFLGAIVDLHWPDSLYTQVEPHLRYENTLTALRTLILAESRCRPVIVHLEDAHWLDEASWTFLTRLTHNVDDYPFAIVMTTRPPEEETGRHEIGRHETRDTRQEMVDGPPLTIRLATLPAVEITALAAAQLRGAPAPALVNLLVERAEGNPFFAEQLLHYLQDQGWLVQGVDGWQLHTEQAPTTLLPNETRALLVARLDRLPQPVKEVVQTAAVLGREFDTQVLAQMVADDTTLAAKLAVADRAAIWSAMTQARYLFRHALLREAAYEMQLRARLRALHQLAGAALEQVYGMDLTPYFGELAYHYDQAEVHGVAAQWYGRAGEQASQQYANDTAASYFQRALTLTPANDAATRYQLLLGSEAVHNWLGQRQIQQEVLASLEAVTEVLNDDVKRSEVTLRKTAFHLSTGRYQQAAGYAEQAVAFALQAGDALAEARAYHRWGRAFWQISEYEKAMPHLQQALHLASFQGSQADEALFLVDWGIAHHYRGNHEEALSSIRKALSLYGALTDKHGQIRCLSTLGIFLDRMGHHSEAIVYFEQSLHLSREVGWRYGESRVLAQMGNALLELGNLRESREAHLRAIELCRAIGDVEAEASSLDTLGLVAAYLQEPQEAITYYEAALTIHQTIDDKRGKGYVFAHLGYSMIARKEWAVAQAQLTQALAIHQGINMPGLAIDTRAGLALLWLSQGKEDRALSFVLEILAWIEENGVAGIEFPVQVYLICFKVFNSLAMSSFEYCARAETVLQTGYTLLRERVDHIQDDSLRQQFINNLPFNQELHQLWLNSHQAI